MRTLMLTVLLLAVGCAGRHAPAWQTTPSGLRYAVIERTDGREARWGDRVTVHESTSLTDGTLIFSTWETGQPITFTLGADQVIDGMEELVSSMRVGERRSAIMPPSITRRERYPDVFGPGDWLVFEAELVAIE